MKQNYFLKSLGLFSLGALIWLFTPFLKSLCVALLMAMAIAPLYTMIQTYCSKKHILEKNAAFIASFSITLIFSIMLFLPLTIILFPLFEHPTHLIDTLQTLGSKIHIQFNNFPPYLHWLETALEKLTILSQMHQEKIVSFITQWLGSGLKTFISMISEIVMILIFFFFLLLYARPLLLFIMPIVPLSRTIKRQFLNEISTTMAIVFYTLLGVMSTQGIAFGVFITFFDGYNGLLLGFLAAITSVIPLIGTALVWVPIAVGEYLNGNYMNAFIITVYSWAIMAFFIDNFVKFFILNLVNRTLNKHAMKINDFILFFSIVGGLTTFGLWGFLIGPALVAFSITTFKLLRKMNQPHL